MKRGQNKEFKIGGIKNLMKTNYDVPTDLIDLEALVDSKLTMSENWYKIKRKVLLLCRKQNKINWD
jgi:hypothetical protein